MCTTVNFLTLIFQGFEVINENDNSHQLKADVESAINNQHVLRIHGGDSKAFYGNEIASSKTLDVSTHTGIVDYEPTELVITVRAGTKIKELEELLAENAQQLPFEPPAHSDNSTIGGVVAAGLSGPRRPFKGSVRDHILGVSMINGHGKIVEFGGQVMKNVAGYDVSRLMVGSLGSLGVLLNISIKLIPAPASEVTLTIETSREKAINLFNQWRPTPLPISATCFYEDCLYVRLSGGHQSISAFTEQIAGKVLENANGFWTAVKNQTHEFFLGNTKPLWRLSFPPATPALRRLEKNMLIEWGGAQYWLYSNAPSNIIRGVAEKNKGHATLYRGDQPGVNHFHPLAPELINLQKRLKNTLDPHGVFASGRLYKGF